MDVIKINSYYDCPKHQAMSQESTGPAKVEQKTEYDLEIKWIDGTTKFQCFIEDQIALPKPIGCVEQQTNQTYLNGEEFIIGENKCRCDLTKNEAKITLLNGCEKFKHEEWILGRYVYNYECDNKENKLANKIVGCTTPLNSNGPKFVRNGEKIESSKSKDKYFCSIYANGTRARNEKRQ